MAESWPSSLPFPQTAGFSMPEVDNSIRTEMAAGAAKYRRRFSATVRPVTLTLVVNRAQVQILDDFVEVTLKDVRLFQMPDFRKPYDEDNVATYRFTRRPGYTPRGNGVHWNATLSLEMLSVPVAAFALTDESEDSLTTDDDEVITS